MKTRLELTLDTDTVRRLATEKARKHPSMELAVFIDHLLCEALRQKKAMDLLSEGSAGAAPIGGGVTRDDVSLRR